MVTPLPIIIALCAAAVVGLAEWLHARRIARVRGLLLGGVSPTLVSRAAPWARVAGFAVLTWGLSTLLTIDGAPRGNAAEGKPVRRVLICLDVSPSMYLEDAGPSGLMPRGKRARQVLQSVFDRLDMTTTRVTVVAFYTAAKPVVVDTFDLEVVSNILEDLPLEHAFKEGMTNMYSGVREAARIAEPWPPGSAMLIVVSDGDTLPDSMPPTMPRSIVDALVVGVGNPHRGSQIAGRSSRQDSASLKQLAARLRGIYHDGNAQHLPSSVLANLRMLRNEGEQQIALRTIALAACGVGSLFVCGMSPLLAVMGLPRAIRSAEGASSARAAARTDEQHGNTGRGWTVSSTLVGNTSGGNT
ncbi:MAG: VWA domain-containing protein [Phycisphaeraceae bacterium]|nr:VWA domain-containing protein [Phycisphaeraceae bacterium]